MAAASNDRAGSQRRIGPLSIREIGVRKRRPQTILIRFGFGAVLARLGDTAGWMR
jgi:hypothetical protein